jgi:3-deoxy-D-manno-octulosonic-acid transferase
MSTRSYARWRRMRGLARPLFGQFKFVLAQNDRLARRFGELGAIETRGIGNLKVDAPPPPVDATRLEALRRAIADRPCWVAASTHPGEETMVAAAHRIVAARLANVLTIVVPRHPARGAQIAEEIAATGLKIALHSKNEELEPDTDVYIADTLGELGTFYRLAPVAFVGGSLVTHGGQNPIEAVRHQAAVVTGPHTGNFADAFSALQKASGARLVNDASELGETVTGLLLDAQRRAAQIQAAERALAGMSGALERTIDALLALLPPPKDDGVGRAAG